MEIGQKLAKIQYGVKPDILKHAKISFLFKKTSLEEQEVQKRGPVFTRKTDHFHDLRRVTGDHDTAMGSRRLFSVVLRDSNVQEHGTKMGQSSTVFVKEFIR